MNQFSRTELLLGKEGIKKLNTTSVAIFGVGGVGSFVVESLARAGVGKLILIDNDDICITNINRQIQATHKTVGKVKVDALKERVLDINPNIEVECHKTLYTAKTAEKLFPVNADYIVDAIDMVTSKLDLIERAKKNGIPIISSMGTGNKLNPAMLEVADIDKTSYCPLAKVIRKELRKRRIKKVKVVYSKEKPMKPISNESDCHTNCVCPPTSDKKCLHKKQIPGSVSFVPSVAGLIIASEVVKDVLNIKK